MYQIIILPKAKKGLKRIPKSWQIRIYEKIKVLEQNPFAGKKLSGELKDYYSIRVWPYRIVYQIYKKQLIIIVVKIAHRGGVY